jgi:hypothetical protein
LAPPEGLDVGQVAGDGEAGEVCHRQLGCPHGVSEEPPVLFRGGRILLAPRGHGDPDLPGQLPVDRSGRRQQDTLDLPEKGNVTENFPQGNLGELPGLRITHNSILGLSPEIDRVPSTLRSPWTSLQSKDHAR